MGKWLWQKAFWDGFVFVFVLMLFVLVLLCLRGVLMLPRCWCCLVLVADFVEDVSLWMDLEKESRKRKMGVVCLGDGAKIGTKCGPWYDG